MVKKNIILTSLIVVLSLILISCSWTYYYSISGEIRDYEFSSKDKFSYRFLDLPAHHEKEIFVDDFGVFQIQGKANNLIPQGIVFYLNGIEIDRMLTKKIDRNNSELVSLESGIKADFYSGIGNNDSLFISGLELNTKPANKDYRIIDNIDFDVDVNNQSFILRTDEKNWYLIDRLKIYYNTNPYDGEQYDCVFNKDHWVCHIDDEIDTSKSYTIILFNKYGWKRNINKSLKSKN